MLQLLADRGPSPAFPPTSSVISKPSRTASLAGPLLPPRTVIFLEGLTGSPQYRVVDGCVATAQTLSPERWAALRRRYFRLHFQYMCAFDRPGHYDYFQITAGPVTLGARYAGRAPSKSRIETPLSGFRSVA